jgi:hypothetical protein
MQRHIVILNRPTSIQPRLAPLARALLLAGITVTSSAGFAATLSNPECPTETAFW